MIRKWIDTVISMLRETEDIKEIDRLLRDWVISSLSAHDKRERTAQALLSMTIDPRYTQVPSDILYRFQLSTDNGSDDMIKSWSYTKNGAKKIAEYYDKAGLTGEIIIKPVSKVNVIICIPTFYQVTKLFSGRMFMRMVSNEKEVLVL